MGHAFSNARCRVLSDVEATLAWRLLLRTGFGNVFPNGRWDHDSTHIIASAVNSGDWAEVEEYAEWIPWDDSSAC